MWRRRRGRWLLPETFWGQQGLIGLVECHACAFPPDVHAHVREVIGIRRVTVGAGRLGAGQPHERRAGRWRINAANSPLPGEAHIGRRKRAGAGLFDEDGLEEQIVCDRVKQEPRARVVLGLTARADGFLDGAVDGERAEPEHDDGDRGLEHDVSGGCAAVLEQGANREIGVPELAALRWNSV